MSQIRVILNQLGKFTDEQKRRLSLNVLDEVVRATPVRSGWAQANWFVSIGPRIGVPVGAKGAAGVPAAEAFQRLSINNLFLTNIRRRRLNLENNVPYINRLNAGSSAQAPAGFVQQAIRIGILRTL